MYQIGFDVGGTNIKAGVVDDQGKIVTYRRVPFVKGENYKKTSQRMAKMAEEMVSEAGCGMKEIQSIGVAVPGTIDEQGKRILNAHSLHFHYVPMKAAIEELFPSKPVSLMNDANAAALGESIAGALRGCKTAVLLTLGTGVGGGLILNGKLFNGGRGHGVELGHMTLEEGGEVCTCGRRGCIESVCAGTWLLKQGRKAVIESPFSLIYTRTAGKLDRVTAKLVVDCAKAGDAMAMDIFSRYVNYLSSAIVSIASLLDPEVIALGGGISLTGDFLYRPLNRLVKEKVFFKCDYSIVPAKLGNDGGIIGAALHAKQNM